MRAQTVRWKIARRHLQRRSAHRLRWVVAAVFLVLLFMTGATAAGAMYFASQLPPVSRFHIQYAFQDARFYDARGDLLYNMADLGKNGGRRVVVPLQALHDSGNACRGGINRIPLLLQNATIATEDASFYKNPGFDPFSILRAAYEDLKYGHIVSGASTITQQLVKQNMLNDERTLQRKAQEVALAYEVSKRYSKRKILWYYLNSVPYGDLAVGAQAAARVYFHEPVCRLDLAQAALLAGLPRAPTLYNPVRHRSAALGRMGTVLQLLWKHGYLRTRAQIARARTEARHWVFRPNRAFMRYPHFVQYAVKQVERMPALRGQLYRGIDVYTTLDPRLQDLAQQKVTSQIDSLQGKNVTDGALVSLDLRPARYGWILAMVGSAHYDAPHGRINMAVSPRQPGSSMKPFNYIWAFSHGNVYPGTTVVDSPIRLPDPNDAQDGGWYQPTNYDHQWHGTITLRQALANSLNVPAVKVEYYITHPGRVAATAYRFGMTSLYRDNPGLGCSVCYAVTLGGLTQGTRLLEETSAYGVFASGGRTVPPVAIWKVVRRSTGKVIYCSEDCPRGIRPDPALARSRRQVLDPAHAYEMTNVLADNSARCTPQVCEFGLNSSLALQRPAAAKTGTTTNWTDNWTVGYTPQIVTGVWTGNPNHSSMINVIGVTGAAPIWHDFMDGAFRILHLPVEGFTAPPGVVSVNQCSGPGSGYGRGGIPDIDVEPPSGVVALPLCAIPERGFMPAQCAAPSTGASPLCPVGTPYTIYGPGTQYNTVPAAPAPGLPPSAPAALSAPAGRGRAGIPPVHPDSHPAPTAVLPSALPPGVTPRG